MNYEIFIRHVVVFLLLFFKEGNEIYNQNILHALFIKGIEICLEFNHIFLIMLLKNIKK